MNPLGTLAKVSKSAFARGSAKYNRKHPAPALPKGVYDALSAPKSDRYTLGFAKTEIMPPDLQKPGDVPKKKYWVAGYRINNPATGVLDPMTCSAVWLDDNSGRGGVFLVSIDNIGMSSSDSDLIQASMQAELEEIGCRGVFIMSTHNHAGIDTLGYWGPLPLSGRNPKFMAILHEGCRRVMRAAYRGRKDGQLYHGTTEAPPVIRDTRPPVVFSNTLTRFRFAPEDGSRETWIINFASHSEAMLGKNSLVSADFPCYLRREILEKAGAETIYFIGAIGGLIRPKELDEDNIKSTISCGVQLGQAALGIQPEDERKLPPLLNILRQPYFAEAENLMLLTAAKLGVFKAKRVAAGGAETGASILTEMTYMNLGGQQMLLLPCELFPELAYGGYLSPEESATGRGPEINPTPLAQIAEDEKLLIFGLCNDMTGYVVPPNDWFLGEKSYYDGCKDANGRNHYEETNSLGPKTAEIVAGVFSGIMASVNASFE
ncbi:MAG: hypothetical protein LBS96_05780 [Oscillospiraceae bacterium]|jgi:hypothetical protein|nr:hypothetical protein [Oscillospiraceae bacterium]